MKNNFAVFILTHGRPENVVTIKTLRDAGYTGKIFLVCDDEDKTLSIYKEKYGKDVIVFNKDKVAKTFDLMDNFGNKKAVVYARNHLFDVAKKLGIDYFLELDDDYSGFYTVFDKDRKFNRVLISHSFDKLCEIYVKYLENTNIKTVAFAQGGDFIGGGEGVKSISIRRKVMNSFFCKTDRPFKFPGTINEDTNLYVKDGIKGDLFFTTLNIQLNQKETQSNDGGLTDIYLEFGTYVKSFYTVMLSPSSVKIKEMGGKNRRLHHNIKWNNTVPKILRG